MRWVWILLGTVSLAMGAIGLFVPLLPTTPFLLLASFAFARSSERVHRWLLEHPRLGPPIRNWHSERSVHRGTKWTASISIAAGFTFSVAVGLHLLILAIQAVILCGVVAYLWTRPEPAS